MARYIIPIIPCLLIGLSSFGNELNIQMPIVGPNVLNEETVTVDAGRSKGLVVVFLSAQCPCSDSHLPEIVRLKEKYPKFQFLGVHSNVDESIAMAKDYFSSELLNFVVVRDTNARVANIFKASKTPHAFVISPDGKVLYRGGVTNSSVFDSKNRMYLQNAMDDILAARPVKNSETRTLGCVIARK